MNGNECRATRQEIDQSELNAVLSAQVSAHLQACSSCRQFHDERKRLREMIGSLEPVTAPANFDLRLRARIAAEQQGVTRQPFFSGFALSTPAMAVSALILVSVASTVWVVQHNRNQPVKIANVTPAKEPPVAPVEKTPIPDQGNLVAGTKSQDPINVSGGRQDGRRNVNSSSKTTQTAGIRDANPTSRDFAVGPQRVFTQMMDQAGQVSLTAPDKPLVLSVQDERGGTRRILLPPVSFGSQRLVDNRVPVTQTSARIW